MKKDKVLKFIIVILNIILLGRIYSLTIKNNAVYQEKLLAITNQEVLGYSAPRGRIIDAKGHILVDNMGIKILVYNKLPNITKEQELDIASQLANVISIDREVGDRVLRIYYYDLHAKEVDNLIDNATWELYKNRKIDADEFYERKLATISDEILATVNKSAAYLYNMMNQGYIFQDKILKSNITDAEFTRINELDLPGIRFDIRWVRKFNYDTCLNVLFGNIGPIASEEIADYLNRGYKRDDIVGVSFLEKYYEDILHGEKARYQVTDNYTLKKIAEEKRGSDLILAIDIETQLAIEDALKEEIIAAKKYPSSKYYTGSYIIIANPQNGDIVALVALKYDGEYFSSDVIGLLANSYTVGSVVKGASQTVAYKYGAIDEKTRVNDSCIKLYSQNEKCSWKRLGTLNDIDALAYSSNYWQFLNAIKVSGQKYTYNMRFNPTLADFNKYRDIFKSYGLGVKTGIDIAEEQLGITGKTVTGDLLLNLSIGQYDTYTPLMLSQYISTLANGGTRYKMRIAKSKISETGEQEEINKVEVLNRVDLDDKYIKRIQEGFIKVSNAGTGAGYVNKQYKPAGKTGTSETYYGNIKTTSKAFIMYAPYDHPEYSMIIVSPHIGYSNSPSSYKYPVNSHLSKKITYILFEK